ncbi:cation transporter [Natroniella acetigena]|uniref:cation transporter n=1 Tax=Natroniella acetigena TaxID=52004 RepID=UPI00200A777E|nr:cation transporter [Natroniella acetigena]MCK8828196.1 cation transporter [Natroniella acetigena]
MKEVFTVKGMSCGHCKNAVESALADAAGVKEVVVDLEAEKVEIEFDESQTDLEKLKALVAEQGYKVS